MRRTRGDPQSQKLDRLLDDVYRQMFLLEGGRPGSEMGLALALLRAWVGAGSPASDPPVWKLLASICPVCIEMIETSLSHFHQADAREAVKGTPPDHP